MCKICEFDAELRDSCAWSGFIGLTEFFLFTELCLKVEIGGNELLFVFCIREIMQLDPFILKIFQFFIEFVLKANLGNAQ